jgi:hypothetical protein
VILDNNLVCIVDFPPQAEALVVCGFEVLLVLVRPGAQISCCSSLKCWDETSWYVASSMMLQIFSACAECDIIVVTPKEAASLAARTLDAIPPVPRAEPVEFTRIFVSL